MKIAFITSVFGQRGNNPARFQRIYDVDYFLFSDRDQKDFNTDWEVINIADYSEIKNLSCNVRKSRYAKFLGWKLLESMGKKYDFIYYCDVHWSPNANINWLEISQNSLNENFTFIQDEHQASHCKKGGIIAECSHIVHCGRDKKENTLKTIKYFQEHYPEINLSSPQYYENTMFGYHPNKLIQSMTEEFWKTYTTANITFRDQPLWNLMLLKYNVKPILTQIRSKFLQTGSYGNHNYT